ARIAAAASDLAALRALVLQGAEAVTKRGEDEGALTSIEFQTRINLLKVEAAERASSIALQSLRACGLAGYRNDGDFSVGRAVRDLLSAPLMISNDRILSGMASGALLTGAPDGLAA
ncbi:MAG: acyl-CoA dehydrogenase, partial [Hyphomicrobiales bacterium]|nr:acyl-CoA dehydrogenase [Hyphomicrobiales bacterium]